MTLDTRTEAEPDTEPGTETGTEPGTTGPGTDSGSDLLARVRRGAPWIALVLAAVVAAVGANAWWQAEHDPDLARAAERDAVLVAARTHVATLNTLDSAEVEAGLAAWGSATTGMLHDQLSGVDDTSRDLLVDLGTSSVGTVTDAAVLELDDTSATVLVSVEVAVTESADEPPQIKRNRFAADLREVDGVWLLENLQQVAVSL